MNRLNRLAIILLLAQPLVVGAGAAFAFSMVDDDSSPGLADPDAALSNLSDQFAQTWASEHAVDSAVLLRQDWVPDGSTDATPLTDPSVRRR